MLTLIDAPRCPYCARVRITLAEKGVEFETVEVDLSDRPDWLYELNSSGRVPVLRQGDWALPESAVIDEFLEERFPEPPLLPPGVRERAAARLLVFRHDDLADPYYAVRRGDPHADEQLDAAFRSIDRVLATQPYLTGAAFGLADIAYLPWVIRARDVMGISLLSYPSVEGWMETVASRPSVAAEIEVVASL